MLSEKQAKLLIRIVCFSLIAAISFFVAAEKIPDMEFVRESYESVEESSHTVMKFSAATLSTSLAISALPDDFATPLAESLADMNIYFVAILVVLFFEKILILYGVRLAFAIVIPLACLAGALSGVLKQEVLKSLALRICVLGLAVAFVVPCSTHLTDYVAAELTAYVEDTINETEAGAEKLTEAMDDNTGEKTIFETLSELFQSAIHDLSDLMTHFRNMIRRSMNSIAILLLINCLIPLMTFFALKWILKEVFQIIIPLPPVVKYRNPAGKSDPDSAFKFDEAGEGIG